MRDGHGAIEGDDGRRIAPVELIVMAQDAFPIGRNGIGRRAMTGRDAGLQMVVADRLAPGRGGEMEQALIDESVVSLRAILIIKPQQLTLFAQASRKTRAAQQHERQQGVVRGVWPAECMSKSCTRRMASRHKSSRRSASPADAL